MTATLTDRLTFVADFGGTLIFERVGNSRRPFTHAVLMPKATAGPRQAAFFASEEQARLRAGTRGRVVAVTSKAEAA